MLKKGYFLGDSFADLYSMIRLFVQLANGGVRRQMSIVRSSDKGIIDGIFRLLYIVILLVAQIFMVLAIGISGSLIGVIMYIVNGLFFLFLNAVFSKR